MVRELHPGERQLIDYLLEPDFPGRDALRAQVATVRAEELDDCPCLRLHVNGSPSANVKRRVPIEAGGENIEILLHVVDGKLNELEFVWKDPSKERRIPAIRELKRFCPDDWKIE